MTDLTDDTAPKGAAAARKLSEAERMHHLDRAMGTYGALWAGYIIENDPKLQEQKDAQLPTVRPQMVAAIRQHIAQSEKPLLCLSPDADRNEDELNRELSMLARGKVPNELTSLHHIAGWQRLDNIAQSLKQRGQPLTKATLQQPITRDGNSYLRHAARLDMLGSAISCLNKQGEQLTIDDLLDNNGKPNALLNQCIHSRQLPRLMSRSNWEGQPPINLQRLRNALPENARAHLTGYHSLLNHLQSQQQTGMGRSARA